MDGAVQMMPWSRVPGVLPFETPASSIQREHDLVAPAGQVTFDPGFDMLAGNKFQECALWGLRWRLPRAP